MPGTLFLQIADMTQAASLVIPVVLLVRLCLKRAPKVFSYALWAAVLFRLLCPVSIETPVSLLRPEITEAIELTADEVYQSAAERMNAYDQSAVIHEAESESSADRISAVPHTASASRLEPGVLLYHIWIAGICLMLIGSGISCIKLRFQLLASVRVHENIFIADDISSPFVMGVFRPRIYLPSSLSEKEQNYIILHEQYHIRRGDHIIKLLAFAALCLHWFNPLVWIAFILSGKDMEMSCDEAVLQRLGENIRADYTASLISLATGQRIIAGTALAFGEGDTEGRVKNIARWKKPALWVIVTALLICAAVGVCLITDPADDPVVTADISSFAEKLDSIAITHYINDHAAQAKENRRTLSAFEVLGYSRKNLYLYVHFAEYDTLQVGHNRTYMPIVLHGTFTSGKTRIKNHSIPEDGVNYGSSMERLFPEEIRDIIAEKEAGGAFMYLAEEADKFAASVYPSAEMIPTSANVTGVFDRYLYVPIDGANYRYERMDYDPASLTKGALMHSFTEKVQPEDRQWRVYAAEEYPDHTVVFAEAGDDSVYLYRYSPPKAVDPLRLNVAKAAGMIVSEEGYATFGQELWNSFYEKTQNGRSASVKLAHYYTLENGNYSSEYYEVYKEDYPVLYTLDLQYDSGIYTLSWEEDGMPYVREYKYLMRYEDSIPSTQSSKEPQKVVRYVLVNDNTVSWNDIIHGITSSQSGDYIAHFSIYTEKE